MPYLYCMATATTTQETTMNNVTTRQLLDEALAAYFHECRVWRSTGHMPWNRDQAKRVGVLSTKCERLRRQLDAEKASA